MFLAYRHHSIKCPSSQLTDPLPLQMSNVATLLLVGCAGAARGRVFSEGFPGGICGTDDSPDDCIALVSLYDAFGGPGSRSCPMDPKAPPITDPWKNWLGGTSYCSWLGIECNDGGFVRRLQLPVSCQADPTTSPGPHPYNAPYQLPPGMGRFVQIEELYLPYAGTSDPSGITYINGTIPAAITNLTTLRIIDGPLKSSGCVMNDQNLNLQACVTGILPGSIGSMKALTSIDWMLSQPAISGTLPATWGGMEGLRQLYLGLGTATPGIPAVGYQNLISGTIAAEIMALPALESLSIQGKQWTGTLPQLKFTSPTFHSLILVTPNVVGGDVFDIIVPAGAKLDTLIINALGFTSISPTISERLNTSNYQMCSFALPNLTGVAYTFPNGTSIACDKYGEHIISDYVPCSTTACPTGLTLHRGYGPCTVAPSPLPSESFQGVNCTGPNTTTKV